MLEEYILKEESLTNKIKQALKSIKAWFIEKMNHTADLLIEYRKKLQENLQKMIIKNDRTIPKDITIKKKDKKIVIAKKGDNVSDVINVIKENLNNYFRIIKKLCNDIIHLCKKAISEIGTIEIINLEKIAQEQEQYRLAMEKKERIARKKEIIIDKLQDAAKVGAIISSLLITGIKIKDSISKIKEKKDND